MKKKLAVIFAALALAASMVMFGGCSMFQQFVADGSSPYDAAVTRGEEGSPESWLSSLSTPTTELRRAYEEATADGSFTGTYFEFLERVGAKDADGARVQTALLSVVSINAHFTKARGGSYISAGSGVIYSLDKAAGDALVVTNYHVVYSSESTGRETISHVSDNIELFLYGGEIEAETIDATFLGGAMDYDIAVLSVKGSSILKETEDHPVYAREVVGSDSDCVTVGETVYAIGNAEGKGMSVTAGVVSVDAEYINVYAADDTTMLKMLEIRTDAAVNHGNSGGGLFNEAGELVGIVNARSEETGEEGFGYAIPANLALSIAQNIIDTCAANDGARGAKVARLGISAEVTDSHGVFDPESGKIYTEESVVISEINMGTAASASSLQTGDTIAFVKLISTRGGEPYEREVAVTRLHKLTNFLMEVRRGDRLEVTVSRGGKLVTVSISYESDGYFEYLS